MKRLFISLSIVSLWPVLSMYQKRRERLLKRHKWCIDVIAAWNLECFSKKVWLLTSARYQWLDPVTTPAVDSSINYTFCIINSVAKRQEISSLAPKFSDLSSLRTSDFLTWNFWSLQTSSPYPMWKWSFLVRKCSAAMMQWRSLLANSTILHYHLHVMALPSELCNKNNIIVGHRVGWWSVRPAKRRERRVSTKDEIKTMAACHH